ncbi:MAG: carbon-nitrogen hydrolase family protein [Isosphaeraceae bacterium]
MTAAESYRVAGVQMEPILGKVEQNRQAILDRLAEASENGARLVVFPECALTGYGFETREEALPFAEAADGPSAAIIREACEKLQVYAVYGFLESDRDRLFNACLLVGPDGKRAIYRKVHLPFLGVDRVTDPGDLPFAVHDAGGVKIGMHICYDGAFPEVGRVLTLLGAELLVLPTNWPTHSECAADHMIATRSMENVVYSMAVNRVGEERGFRFIGRSSITATNGTILAKGSDDAEEILYADIIPAVARRKRLIRVAGKHEVDRIADRRPGFYGPIVAPNGRD